MAMSLRPGGPEEKIEAFCVNHDREIAYVGTMGGTLMVVSTRDLSKLFEISAHTGFIAAVAYHPGRKLVACLGGDNTVSVWRANPEGVPEFLCRIPLWDIQPSNDERTIPDFQSESQALAFSDHYPRLATRSANGALLEINIDDFGRYEYLHCTRLFRSSDLTCVQYVPGTPLCLAGSIDGQLGIVFSGDIVGQLETGGSNIHWIEPAGGSEFLLASDSRQVIRVDLYRLDEPVIGPKFCRDDLEHVALSLDGKSAFAASFDRKVYAVDPITCRPEAVVFDAPFKCRWVRPVDSDGERLIVQTRDGGLHLVDPETRRALHSLRDTPPALWTADRRSDGRFSIAGEPDAVFTVDLASRRTTELSIAHVTEGPLTYTKRLITLSGDAGCLLGRTDGSILHVRDDGIVASASVGAPVRDLCEGPADAAFVALEDGRVVKLDLDTLSISATFRSPLDEPIWSLAYDGRDTLAIAERGGRLRLLSSTTLQPMHELERLARPKRMKWSNPEKLLYVWSDQLHSLDMNTFTTSTVVNSIGNTIEDFIICAEYDYIVCISYMRNLYLARLSTGEILSMAPDGDDYSKGLAWLTPPGPVNVTGPLQFFTFGRHGSINLYKISNEKILPLDRMPAPGVSAGEGSHRDWRARPLQADER